MTFLSHVLGVKTITPSSQDLSGPGTLRIIHGFVGNPVDEHQAVVTRQGVRDGMLPEQDQVETRVIEFRAAFHRQSEDLGKYPRAELPGPPPVRDD